MIIRDDIINVNIEVKNKFCRSYNCYYPRASKESFMPTRNGSGDWICLGKANNSCPDKPLLED